MNDVIGLFPELDFRELTVVPAISDNAMRVRCRASQVGGLRGARDGGKRRLNPRLRPARGEITDPRRVLSDERIRESDHIDNDGALQGAIWNRAVRLASRSGAASHAHGFR